MAVHGHSHRGAGTHLPAFRRNRTALGPTPVRPWQRMAALNTAVRRTYRHWTERVPREAAEDLIQRHPGVEVSTEQRAGALADVLVEAARDGDLLVLGSRAPSGLGGFRVGSVGQSVVRRNPFGAHIGAVTHAVLHHVTAPVAVVAHD